MVIRIKDYFKIPSTYEDGEKIYNLIVDEIGRNGKAVVSFEGISSVPSAFINSAFIRLLDTLSFDEVRSRLLITNSTKHINELIKSRFEFVLSKKDDV